MRNKDQWLLTAVYTLAFVGTGVTEVIGTTLPILADVLGEESSMDLSYGLLTRGAGYFVGTLLIGWAIDVYPCQAHHWWLCATLIFGGAAIVIPYSRSMTEFCGVMFAFGAGAGAVLLAGNVLVIRIWHSSMYAGSALNLIHVGNSLGSSIMPMIAWDVWGYNNSINTVYQVLGIVILCLGLWPIFFPAPPKIDEEPSPKEDVPIERKHRWYFGVSIMFLYYFFYAGILTDAGDWITTFVVRDQEGDEDEGTQATSLFWTSVLAIRVICVPISAWISYDIIITVEFILALAGCILLLTYGIQDYIGTVLGWVLIGLGIAAMYPAGLILARRRMVLSAKVISFMLAGGVLGTIFIPTTTGVLLQHNLDNLPWSELGFVLFIGLSYLIVYLMPVPEGLEALNYERANNICNLQAAIPQNRFNFKRPNVSNYATLADKNQVGSVQYSKDEEVRV